MKKPVIAVVFRKPNATGKTLYAACDRVMKDVPDVNYSVTVHSKTPERGPRVTLEVPCFDGETAGRMKEYILSRLARTDARVIFQGVTRWTS